MASKVYSVDGIGDVTVFKRRGTRRLNLRIVGGKVRVTQPTWLPYATGLQFAQTNKQWITKQFDKQPDTFIEDGMVVGKHRVVSYETGSSLRTKITANALLIYLPPHMSVIDSAVQQLAKNAIKRALKKEAEDVLPERLAYVAEKYGFEYTSVHCKSMRSRWGSCNSKQEITLNIFLTMVPWELIDYVLVHELAHTKHLHHGKAFWDEVQAILPDYKQRRKSLKDIQTSIAHLQ